MREKPIFRIIASAIEARENCLKSGNREWYQRWTTVLERVMQTAPSGSGIDCGTQLELSASSANKLVFSLSYHHHTEHGYNGWTTHTVTVRPHLVHDLEISISGKDRDQIKDYLHEVYHAWLTESLDDRRQHALAADN